MKPLDPIKSGFQQNEPQSRKKLKMSHVLLPTDSPRSHHIRRHFNPYQQKQTQQKCVNCFKTEAK